MRYYSLIIGVIVCVNVFSQHLVELRSPYLFILDHEVTNQEYSYFLEDLSSKDPIHYKCYYPDTNKWQLAGGYMDDFISLYHLHPAYLNYPVVNVTHEAAIAYCDWLTIKLNKIDTTKRVLVRLPTEKEWEFAAKAGKDGIYPWEGHLPWQEDGKRQGRMIANFKRGNGDYMGIAGSLNDGADIMGSVKSFPHNDFGIYDMGGNVEEMIDEIGVTKGGSWKDDISSLEISERQLEDSASPEVGFRYVVEVEKIIAQSELNPVGIDEKFIKQQFKKINDTLWGGMYEVSNQLYNQFLADTKKETKEVSWNAIFPYSSFYELNYQQTFLNYPLVNITKEEAKQFAAWLTQKVGIKIGFNFRLPKEEEWLLMASYDHSNFPWKENSIRNKKGEYIANFCPKKADPYYFMEEIEIKDLKNFTDLTDYDGFGVLAPINSFDANSKGFFNLAGNAAEMLDDRIYSKGGSWASTQEKLEVGSMEFAVLPSPFVGVRLVAVVSK